MEDSCQIARITLLIPFSASPYVMIITTEPVPNLTPVLSLLFSHLSSKGWMICLDEEINKVYLVTQDSEDSWLVTIKIYSMKCLNTYIHLPLDIFCVEHEQKIQLLRSLEKLRSLPNENRFKFLQIFLCAKCIKNNVSMPT